MKYAISFILLSMFLSLSLSATHIKGGFLRIKEVRGNTVLIEFNGYRDINAAVPFGSGILSFGDGTSITSDFELVKKYRSNQIEVFAFEVEHTYSGSGTYTVSYAEEYRSEGLLNLENSLNTEFAISLSFTLDPFVQNNLPEIHIDHLVDRTFEKGLEHQSSVIANDSDGDLLIFNLEVPRLNGQRLNGYTMPPASIDQISGDLFLDIPNFNSGGHHQEYLMVVSVTEYRKINNELVRLSKQVLDFNLEVSDHDHGDNDCHPLIAIDPTSCASSQEEISITIATNECEEGSLSFNFEGYVLNNGYPAVVADQLILNDTSFTLYPQNATKNYEYGSVQYTTGEQMISQSLLLTDDCETNEDLIKLVTSESEIKEFSIFPNPSRGVFDLTATSTGTLRIISLNGKQILNQVVSNDVLSLDISQMLESGVYIAQYFDQQERLIGTKRIVIVQ